LSNDDHYDLRIRYLIKDILDLRNKNWEDPKKIKKNEKYVAIDGGDGSIVVFVIIVVLVIIVVFVIIVV
jgi:hypothetical protein